MKTIQGKFNSAVIFTDVVDESSLAQVQLLCDQPFTEGAHIRMMPDIHAGAGCTIGTTMTITDKIVPNLVGVDIGCGMYAIELEQTQMDYAKLDETIRAHVPFGREVRPEKHEFANEIDLTELRCYRMVNDRRAIRSIGTLGGGNHFIEIDRDENGKLWLVIHSGSRYLGLQVANTYQEIAWQALNHTHIRDLRAMIDEMKANGQRNKIEKTIKKLRKQVITDIPKDLAYVENEDFEDYLHDMEIVQKYAELNRKAMADVIIREMKLDVADAFTTIHNYIDIPNRILRKGAVSAKLGETLLIPVNMRDGSLICKGKGNDEWNQSAPHGAGRLFSRTQAKQTFSVEEFQATMDGIFTTSVSADTLDECPMVYKRMEDIVDNIAPTVDILQVIKPEYNFKASE
ncbi:MAG: RtcB family protein [Proteobacteria bacterium]|nr:RtcB family protein [Pseudomonadota bacterium]MBQ9243572.1 RtcB family protein [Pseudomonadota bacterium]